MPVEIVGDGWPVCDCCAVWIANADDSGCRDACGTPTKDNREHPSDLGSFPGWPQLRQDPTAHIVLGDPESRTDFSRVPCWGCGSQLDGARTECVVLSTRPEIWV